MKIESLDDLREFFANQCEDFEKEWKRVKTKVKDVAVENNVNIFADKYKWKGIRLELYLNGNLVAKIREISYIISVDEFKESKEKEIKNKKK